MLGSVLILNVKYGVLDWLACLMMCFGVAAFVLAGRSLTPEFNNFGKLTIKQLFICHHSKLSFKVTEAVEVTRHCFMSNDATQHIVRC